MPRASSGWVVVTYSLVDCRWVNDDGMTSTRGCVPLVSVHVVLQRGALCLCCCSSIYFIFQLILLVFYTFNFLGLLVPLRMVAVEHQCAQAQDRLTLLTRAGEGVGT